MLSLPALTPLDLSFAGLTAMNQIVSQIETDPTATKLIVKSKAIKLSNNQLVEVADIYSVLSFKPNFLQLSWIDLSFNQIKEIPDCLAEFKNLKVLYLHSNAITNGAQVQKLAKCTELRCLTLHGNPFEYAYKEKAGNAWSYRVFILTFLPNLKSLDFVGVSRAMTIDMLLLNTECPDLQLVARGKVRDIYDFGDCLLFVATDRLSAFDVIMKNGIPGKGKLLTQMSTFWFAHFNDIPNHVITTDIEMMPEKVQKYREQLEGRTMLVKKLRILPVEAIVRGFITGSAWKEYTKSGTICNIKLPEGLQECQELERPLFTPSTKADIGGHVTKIIGADYAKKVEEMALALYTRARDYAKTKGIIIADTKFEFGVDESGQVVLADEVLTPDSSRFWPADEYQVGRSQASFDKQFVRDFLDQSQEFKKNRSIGISLPEDVVQKTLEKYQEAYARLAETADF